jgi:hypothetical protein
MSCIPAWEQPWAAPVDLPMPVPSVDALDARLDAQRKVLHWLLVHTVQTPEELDDLVAHLDQPRIPQDHQEDPGAVPTEAFGVVSAFNAEMRAILDPVKRLKMGG